MSLRRRRSCEKCWTGIVKWERSKNSCRVLTEFNKFSSILTMIDTLRSRLAKFRISLKCSVSKRLSWPWMNLPLSFSATRSRWTASIGTTWNRFSILFILAFCPLLSRNRIWFRRVWVSRWQINWQLNILMAFMTPEISSPFLTSSPMKKPRELCMLKEFPLMIYVSISRPRVQTMVTI